MSAQCPTGKWPGHSVQKGSKSGGREGPSAGGALHLAAQALIVAKRIAKGSRSGGWEGPSAGGAFHLDIHPAAQALIVEEVVAWGDHAGPGLAHVGWVHADHTLTACNNRCR